MRRARRGRFFFFRNMTSLRDLIFCLVRRRFCLFSLVFACLRFFSFVFACLRLFSLFLCSASSFRACAPQAFDFPVLYFRLPDLSTSCGPRARSRILGAAAGGRRRAAGFARFSRFSQTMPLGVTLPPSYFRGSGRCPRT